MSFCIEDELKKLPNKSGVYIMHGLDDEIIYVGKAVNLKNRVRQYFQSSRGKGPKILKMVSQISRFEYIVTDSELEALILECNLIKEHRPKYNTLLKDDKSYPYIKVTLEEDFPRVFSTRKYKKDGSAYFGPYSNVSAVNETIELTRKLFGIRSCNKRLKASVKEERPCLYHHIHQCGAPCCGYISKTEYSNGVKAALGFLKGNYQDILKGTEKKMREASEEMRFEEAIKYRDIINGLKHISESQKASAGEDDKDIIALAAQDSEAIAQIFFIRSGRLTGREHYHLIFEKGEETAELLLGFVKQFYSGTPFVPGNIMLSEEIPDREIIVKWLSMKRGQSVKLHVPKRGEKEKLVRLAYKNAQIVLRQDLERLKKEETQTKNALNGLSEMLNIESLNRIEAYDISNISGFESVGSMIVYENGMPKKADYRKFRLKSVSGPDDYASMKEVLERRFKRALMGSVGFDKLPDIILMDGGKGQVNAALAVLNDIGLEIPVAGMVKDDKHRTRGLYFNNAEIDFSKNSDSFRLVCAIQEEVHRFAITYHRILRSKGQVKSLLDDIPQIGSVRKKELMKAFENIEQLKAASLEELKKVPSMNEASAKAVINYFGDAK